MNHSGRREAGKMASKASVGEREERNQEYLARSTSAKNKYGRVGIPKCVNCRKLKAKVISCDKAQNDSVFLSGRMTFARDVEPDQGNAVQNRCRRPADPG